jgi:hypothetical protein
MSHYKQDMLERMKQIMPINTDLNKEPYQLGIQGPLGTPKDWGQFGQNLGEESRINFAPRVQEPRSDFRSAQDKYRNMSFQPFTGASLPQWAVDALAASKVGSGYFTGKHDWDPSASNSFTTDFSGTDKNIEYTRAW